MEKVLPWPHGYRNSKIQVETINSYEIGKGKLSDTLICSITMPITTI